MKHPLPILALFTLHASLFTLPAAVPLRWTVETSRAQVAKFESYRGETLDLEATMQSYGSPLATPVQPSLYWQTNGMGAAWWTAPATASGNVLRATWSPTNDCGGTVYNCFIGGTGATYRAAFRLRMLPSPGFTPNHIPLPTVKDESDPVFSSWIATNELFSAGVDTNTVLDLIASATNGLATAADLGDYLQLSGGTLTGDLAVGEEHTASRRLTVAAEKDVEGITLQGGKYPGIGSRVTVGGSSGGGGEIRIQGGGRTGGRLYVGSYDGTGGGAIEVRGMGASIKKDGSEVATETYVNTQVSGVESTLTTLAGAVNAKADASSVYTKIDIDEQVIAASNQTFSNAVLAVGLNIDTNSVAVLNEIAETFGGFPIEGAATTVGGLLAALAAAVAWLKNNKVQTLKIGDNSVETSANGGVAKLDDFFTESNSLLTATIDARLPYPLYAVTGETGLLKDRAINTTSLASVTVPDNFTDLLIRASVASSLSVTMPEAIAKKYGDTFPGEAGEYLITITKTGAAEAYVRTIKLEEVA